MINARSNLNLLAVSAGTMEDEINSFQTLDQSLMVGDGDYLNLTPRRENNAGEATGKEEADSIYDNGATVEGTFNFEKLRPNQAAFLLAYGLGNCASIAAGAGKQHTITPISGDIDQSRSNPSFTAAQRIGNALVKRRFASCFVDTVSLNFNTDDWIKGSGGIKGTGKYESTVEEEIVNELNDTTTLTLAANGVQGSTPQERLDNVQVVRASESGIEYKFATVTAVSADTPAVITIESLGGDGLSNIDYKILYTPVEPAWASFPAKITESPMRVSEMCLYMGGGWNGTSFIGGTKVGASLRSLEYSLQNNLSIEFTSCAGGAYAGRCFRPARSQTIKLTREMRNLLMQQYMSANEYFGLHLLAEGAEFDTGHKFTLELIFPRLGILSAPLSTDNKRIAEAGDLQVLQDGVYGSVISRVKNLVNQYAQAA